MEIDRKIALKKTPKINYKEQNYTWDFAAEAEVETAGWSSPNSFW